MSVGRTYAKALYSAAEDIVKRPADLDLIETQLDTFVSLLKQSTDLRNALTNPAIDSQSRVGIIEKVGAKAGFSPLTIKFLLLLTSKDRLSSLQDIADAFASIRLEETGGTLGLVTSADPLEQNDLDQLSRAFTQKVGKKVAFRTSVDSSLLAGVKVTVNGVTYDGTLRSQLQQLRDRLVYGSKAEAPGSVK